MSKIVLPDLGEGIEEGELVQWLIKVGDEIQIDQGVAEILTDKAAMELPSPVAGKVTGLKFSEGDMIRVGQVMVLLEGAVDEDPTSVKKAPDQPPTRASKSKVGEGASQTLTSYERGPSSPEEIYPSVAQSHIMAAPSTRRAARELGVNINRVKGSGPAGRVLYEDVLVASQSSGLGSQNAIANLLTPSALVDPKGRPIRRVPLRGIRKKISENMQRSKLTIPHFSLLDELNADPLVAFREKLSAKVKDQGIKITYLPLIMKGLVVCVKEFPEFNASMDDLKKEIVYRDYYDFGFAADTPQGLMVPVIRNVDQKSVVEIAQEIVSLASRAREGKLQRDELTGSTISITNIGSITGNYATPIINHPEVAIVGMYRIYKKPVWIDSQWKPVSTMNVSVTCDHRLIDGAVAARFLKRFLEVLQEPEKL